MSAMCESYEGGNELPNPLIRGTALDGRVRAFAVNTTELVEQLRVRHDTWATATAAFGRTLTAGAMISAMLKDQEKVTIQVKGNGPLGQIVVDANAQGDVRGYVDHPHVHLPNNAQGKLDVASAVGKEGFIYVTRDLGMGRPYQGSVPIISGELAEDFTYYFAVSEQIPSAVALGVLVNPDHSVKAAGGFIIQMLPGATEDDISGIEERLAHQKPVTELLEQGVTLEQMLQGVLPSFQTSEQQSVHFQCQCSHQRVEQALISLGEKDLDEIIEEDRQAEIICHFCNEPYRFDKEELIQLKAKITK